MIYNYGDSFGFALSCTSGVMKNRFYNLLREYDVTPDQTVVLLRLSEQEGVSPTMLAEALAKDKPTTVRIIDKLLQKDLVYFEKSATDKRSYLVLLTPKGSALTDQLIPIAEKLKKQALNGFLPEEIELFTRFLKKVQNNLQ